LWRVRQTTGPIEGPRPAEYADRAESGGRERKSTGVLARVLAHTVAPNAQADAAGQQQRSRSGGSHSMRPLANVRRVEMHAGSTRPANLSAARASATKSSKTTVRGRSRVRHARSGAIQRHATRSSTAARNDSRSVASFGNERARTLSSQPKRKAHRRFRHEPHRLAGCGAFQHRAGSVHIVALALHHRYLRGQHAELEAPLRNFGTDWYAASPGRPRHC
jgi:hypothetical protein